MKNHRYIFFNLCVKVYDWPAAALHYGSLRIHLFFYLLQFTTVVLIMSNFLKNSGAGAAEKSGNLNLSAFKFTFSHRYEKNKIK